jgi:hypothetical protein
VVIDPNAPIGNNTGSNTGNANTVADVEDPYKDFVVPDDLTW